jgi:hypothetical protein
MLRHNQRTLTCELKDIAQARCLFLLTETLPPPSPAVAQNVKPNAHTAADQAEAPSLHDPTSSFARRVQHLIAPLANETARSLASPSRGRVTPPRFSPSAGTRAQQSETGDESPRSGPVKRGLPRSGPGPVEPPDGNFDPQNPLPPRRLPVPPSPAIDSLPEGPTRISYRGSPVNLRASLAQGWSPEQSRVHVVAQDSLYRPASAAAFIGASDLAHQDPAGWQPTQAAAPFGTTMMVMRAAASSSTAGNLYDAAVGLEATHKAGGPPERRRARRSKPWKAMASGTATKERYLIT